MVGTTDHNLLVGVSAPRGNLYASIMDPRSTSSAGRTRALPASIILAKGLNAENRLTPPSAGKNFLLTFPFIEPARKGLNAENRPTPPSLGKNFLLTFPFYRTRPV